MSDVAAEQSTAPVSLRRQALRERVADEILIAAARELAATGGQASMNDVATAAGIARGTLYRYFPTRRALLERLSAVGIEDAAARMKAARIDQVEPLEGLERAIRVFVDAGEVFVLAARERSQLAGFDVVIMRPLRALLERGQKAGLVTGDMEALWLSESLLGLTLAGAASVHLGTEDKVASIKRVFLDGARAR
jgi:AcrR family transcriptional regulator